MIINGEKRKIAMEIAYILMLMSAAMGDLKVFSVSQTRMMKAISLFIVVMAAACLFISGRLERVKTAASFVGVYGFVLIGIIVWSIFLWIINIESIDFILRGASKFMYQYKKATGRLLDIQQEMTDLSGLMKKEKREYRSSSKMVSNMTKEEFCANVEKAKEYIKNGDIFQVVLSQRFTVETNVSPFNTYRALRLINPSPYMYYLNFGDYQIAGASPEMLVRVENGVVQTGPIAGTRPRGKTVEEDMALEKELLADKKEIAEHTMLVDLGRNDIGRVSEFGSVKVTRFKYVERFSHVMHIITDVEGKLRSDKTCFDALGSTLPAGTLSGAPKIRAMEIIDELEKTKRSTYGGAIGYISFNGNFDSCITIRTGVFKDGKAYIQAGGGIVYDSIPENEYQESINKASAVLRAIEEAGDIV